MKKAMVAGIIGLVLVAMPAAVVGQSMGGKRHGMMDEPTIGQTGGTAGSQRMPAMPYGPMMGECGMGGSMMGYGMMGMMHGSGMGSMDNPMMGGTGMGMMHGWYGADDMSSEKMRSFLDRTRDLRKQIHDLRFEYGEKMRNPETTIGDLQDMQDKLIGLKKQVWQEYRNQ